MSKRSEFILHSFLEVYRVSFELLNAKKKKIDK